MEWNRRPYIEKLPDNIKVHIGSAVLAAGKFFFRDGNGWRHLPKVEGIDIGSYSPAQLLAGYEEWRSDPIAQARAKEYTKNTWVIRG